MDKLFQILDVNTGLSVFNKILAAPLTCLKWSQSIILLGCEDGVVSVWDIVEVKPLFEINKAHDGGYYYCYSHYINTNCMICRTSEVY